MIFDTEYRRQKVQMDGLAEGEQVAKKERMSAIMARTFLLQAVVRSSNCSTTKRRKTMASASLPSDRHRGRYLPQLSAPHAPHSKASSQSSLRTYEALSEQNDARELVDSAPIAASLNLTIPESLKAFYWCYVQWSQQAVKPRPRGLGLARGGLAW